MSVISHFKRKTLGHVFCGSDAPDNSGANAAALANAELSKESLEFFKQEMARTQGTRDEATQIANDTARLQLNAAKTGIDQAQEAYQYQTGTFRPVEQQLVSMAQNFDTPERRDAEASQAVADVNMAASAGRTATMRELARRNGSISGGRALALMDSQDIGAAKAAGSAANTARRSVEQQGWARMADVANLGRNIASGQATTQSVANQSGASAVQAAGAMINGSMSGAQMMAPGFQQAINANSSAGSLYGNIAGQEAANNASKNQAIGSAVGTAAMAAAMFFSSKNAKTDKRAINEDDALDAVMKMPVESWRYKEGAVPGDSATHIGPYAQDAHKHGGDKLAPGGHAINAEQAADLNKRAVEQIASKVDRLGGGHPGHATMRALTAGVSGNDPISQNGVTMAAIQALAKKVTRLERAARS